MRLTAAAPLWIATATALAIMPAIAAEPEFAGTWASDIAQCQLPQDDQNAPLVLTAKGFDQHEAHCTFTSLEGAAPDWTAKADCQVEGSTQQSEFKFTVSGETLTQTDEAGARDLLRCP